MSGFEESYPPLLLSALGLVGRQRVERLPRLAGGDERHGPILVEVGAEVQFLLEPGKNTLLARRVTVGKHDFGG